MVNKEFLRNHQEHRRELQDELQRYELDHGFSYYGKSPSNIDGMPHASGNPSSVYDQIDRSLDIETYIDKLEAIINQEKKEIEEVLAQLKKASEKSVIRFKYYNCLEWDDVAFYMFSDRRDYCNRTEFYKNKAQKIHGAALANMMRIQSTVAG